ncbi:MAG TPA: low affinity iron permease family protein [Caulifigura sp.]|jgi:low affinity Fe/Cu permease|nr:low affinity iron permease family protein [Caulifigura sp.]
MHRRSLFNRFTKWAAHFAGHPAAFCLAVLVVVVWALTGPIFNYSEAWQLVINTGTTIITFLMVFLIQSAQNRDSAAVHLKLDELIRAFEGAQNALLDLEELDERDLEKMRDHFESLAEEARRNLQQ